MQIDLMGRNALVTGSTRGIGRAIAQSLRDAGARVAIVGRDQGRADAVAAEVGNGAQGFACDVSDVSQVTALVEAVEKAFGGIDILVNNAGLTRDNILLRLKDDDWDCVLDTDLKAVFRLSKAVMRGMMKARQGRIINVTSVVGHAGNPGQANYCAAKAGVSGMSRALARELGSRNITVNCVAPGLIDTDMTRALDDRQKELLLGGIPLARFGSPEDVAAAVAFLASPSASYITGTTLHVNGGMFMS